MNLNLPIHIVESHVLPRLSLKILTIFKCTCKSWYNFITTYLLLNRSEYPSPAKTNLLLVQRRFSGDIIIVDKESWTEHAKLACNYNDTRIVGSSHGIVCLHRRILPATSYSDFLCLWNPILKVFKYTGHRILDYTPSGVCLGFGIHRWTRDYKVVRITGKDADVYSLRLDSWKNINYPKNLGFLEPNCASVNESAHWLSKNSIHKQFHDSIISFDFSEEVFREMKLPTDSLQLHTSIFNYKNRISVFAPFACKSPRYSYLWVMTEYGEPQSWTKLLTIDILEPVKVCLGFNQKHESVPCSISYFLEPMALDADDNKLLLSKGSLFWKLEDAAHVFWY